MRRIIKSNRQPDFFREWKSNYRRNTKSSATYPDLNRNRTIFLALKETIKKEQFYLCCYCCNTLSENGCHIEHFVPRSVDRSSQLDYHNMFVSCNGYVQDISTIDRESCGHRRFNWYDRNLIVSPMDPECEKIFIFLSNGEIISEADNDKARAMIEHFGLNSYALTKAREAAIDCVLQSIGFLNDSIDKKGVGVESQSR